MRMSLVLASSQERGGQAMDGRLNSAREVHSKKKSARESSHVKRLGSVRPGWSITELKKYS